MNPEEAKIESTEFAGLAPAAGVKVFPFCLDLGKKSSGWFSQILNGLPRGAISAVATVTELHDDGTPHAGDASVATMSVTYNSKEGVMKVLYNTNWRHSQIRVGVMGALFW